MDIILYLTTIIQYLYQMNCWLILFICRHIPLRQWAHDDSHSPKYQKFKTDRLPKILYYEKWDYRDYIPYPEWRYNKKVKPVVRRKECDIPDVCKCPRCNAPKPYLYKNNGAKGQVRCKFCSTAFSPEENRFTKSYTLRCPYCSHACLTMRVSLGLSLRKTAQALKDLCGIQVSHQQVANYCKTAALCIKPFADHYDYKTGSTFTADETCIKVRGVKGYVWLIMDAAKRSITGCQVSDNRGVGPCIPAMRMALRNLKKLPENFRFIADGYSAYPLAAQQFYSEYGDDLKFEVTQVTGLSNGDEVSKEFRPYKQIIERVNRTYKASYRPTNGFDSYDGAGCDPALRVAYYNFLRPHRHAGFAVLNKVEMLENAGNMPAKWQLLILPGQQTILNLQKQGSPAA